MSVIGSNILAGASGQGGGYEIERSLRFNSGDSAYLNRTPSSAGNRKTWTWSGWVKLGNMSADGDVFAAKNGSAYDVIKFESGGKIRVYFQQTTNGELYTVALLRDPSAWYHLHVAFDTTQATSTNRFKLYLNGTLQDLTGTYPGQNIESWINGTYLQTIGRGYNDATYFNGYLADVHFIDGQALAATDFGAPDPTNGVWQPIEYAWTYGTNGYHLDFADNSSNAALGTDTSSNNNTWTVNNLSVGRAFNQSQTWSTAGTITGSAWPDGLSNYTGVFSGGSVTSAAGGNYAFAGSNTFYRYTFPSSGLTVNSYVKVYYWKNGGTLTVNAGESNQQSITASTQVYTSTTYNSSTIGVLKNVQVETSVNTGPYLIAIEVDGLLLVDAGISDPLAYNIDSLLDSPTNGTQVDSGAGGEVVGNYATLNSIDKGSNVVLSNGNLEYTKSTTTWSDSGVRGTFGISSGKWYWEVTKNSTASESQYGVAANAASFSEIYGSPTESWTYYSDNGNKFGDGLGGSGSSYGATFANGDVIGVALDMDAGTLVFYKNGTSQGTAFSSLSGKTVFPWLHLKTSGDSAILNTGSRAFAHTAPSGYKSLNTANLPTPTIADGSQYFDTKLVSGNSSTQTISGFNFSPDFVWAKSRSHTTDHYLFDTVRGATNELKSNSTSAEGSNSGLTQFNSDGYNIGSDSSMNTSGRTYVNWAWDAGANSDKTYAITVANPGSGNKYYADGALQPTLTLAEGSTYKFDQSAATNSGHPLRFSTTSDGTHGGGSEYTTGVTTVGTPGSAGAYTQIVIAASAPTLYAYCTNHSGMGFQVNTSDTGGATNLDGTIASRVMANPSAGCSIVSWTCNGSTNQTIGHGLNATPEFMIFKNRDRATNWTVFHKSVTTTTQKVLYLNSAAAVADYSGGSSTWWNALPTSSVFSVGDTGTAVNHTNGDKMITYCFAPVEGHSAMGLYVGNGSADGPFVFTGFKVAWLMVKNASTSNETWTIYDAARDPHNLATNRLQPNAADEETSGAAARDKDFLSNGFKIRGTSGEQNTNGNNYIYVAFAENPFASNGGLAR
jgi:hypothetical protein